MTNGKANILVVDDRPANLIALDALLASDERVLITAHSGHEALEILTREKVDLILLDVQMPDMNGFELAQALRAGDTTSGIPILFVTAEKQDHASRMKGFAEGAIDYLYKPLDPEVTRAKVKVLLEVQQRKKELTEKNVLLERSALLISNAADILGIVDAETGLIEEMNPAFDTLFGISSADYHSKPLTDFMDSAGRSSVEKWMGSGMEKFSFETRVADKERQIHCLEWKVVVRAGKWFMSARDITEVKHLNVTLQRNILQLQEANKDLEAFSYSVSHDLRAPLRAVNGNACIVEEDFGDVLGDEARKYLKKIKDSAGRMDRLINDLLSFFRINTRALSRSAVDMDALVRDVVAEVGQVQPHKARIEISTLPEAYGDRAMLKQVWTNLISNALKYTSKKEAPVIEIGATTDAESSAYFVRDNGVGFNMAYAEKLFGTFQRLHDASEFEGTGIGLAIVQRIIRKHGGTVHAEGVQDAGAKFSFKVPARSET